MQYEEYANALKAGQKEFRGRLMKGMYPYLPDLDEILSYVKTEGEMNLGLCEVPLELIVGTKTKGRSNSFAANFMPLLAPSSEFAYKWVALCDSLQEVGLREPVKAYEFMNCFYVLEGNKRVSVLKHLDAYSVPCRVIRVVPQRTDSKENVIYYEFMDFYAVTGINYIYFSESGRFARLLEEIGTPKGSQWTDDDRLDFSSVYARFRKAFEAKGGKKLPITVGDALLAFITVFGYAEVCKKDEDEMKRDLAKIWEEFLVLTEEQSVELFMKPSSKEESPSLYKNLLNLVLPDNLTKLKIAFFYAKSPETSSWTYSHELGRLHLEKTFPGQVETVAYPNTVPGGNDLERMEQAIADGCRLLFATTPVMIPASLKIAANHPDVKILNCSLNISHPILRTYYARMYEAKFLAGVIAGAMTATGKIGYIANYPIYGMAANINAFALGAKMVNPNARVYLDWSTRRDRGVEILRDPEINYVIVQDMTPLGNGSHHFGLYCTSGELPEHLAMTTWHWGKLYERIVRIILSGNWKNDDNATGSRAINYWWGMSAGVIELTCSPSLPQCTKRLIDLLQQDICSERLVPFANEIRAQDGRLMNGDGQTIPPQEIITMDWLADNVVGSIPPVSELNDAAQEVVRIQGLSAAQASED